MKTKSPKKSFSGKSQSLKKAELKNIKGGLGMGWSRDRGWYMIFE